MDPSTNFHYWLHWQVAICFFSVLACLGTSVYLLWRYEGTHADRQGQAGPAAGEAGAEGHARSPAVIYNEEAWRPCRALHPGWLLAYRLVSFIFFLVHNICIISHDHALVFFYTEWTFTLVTAYFGLAAALSIYGCFKFAGAANDIEHGTDGEHDSRELAGFWTYLLQIIYQTSAGAVMLTDCVFWFIIFPYNCFHHLQLTYTNSVMHSLNAVFLIGDALLHSLPFPWFRLAYFFLFTSVYVIFQWIVHASQEIPWPYPFLDLSSKRAPLWYIAAGLMQIPCYMAFGLLTQLKLRMLLKWKPVNT